MRKLIYKISYVQQNGLDEGDIERNTWGELESESEESSEEEEEEDDGEDMEASIGKQFFNFNFPLEIFTNFILNIFIV